MRTLRFKQVKLHPSLQTKTWTFCPVHAVRTCLPCLWVSSVREAPETVGGILWSFGVILSATVGFYFACILGPFTLHRYAVAQLCLDINTIFLLSFCGSLRFCFPQASFVTLPAYQGPCCTESIAYKRFKTLRKEEFPDKDSVNICYIFLMSSWKRKCNSLLTKLCEVSLFTQPSGVLHFSVPCNFRKELINFNQMWFSTKDQNALEV